MEHMSEKKLRLHLGCQGKYLEGYVNIDLPQDEHPVESAKVDLYSDVRDLIYPSGTVDEIRLHHLFEHFTRQEALLLLARWHSWLKMGGEVFIETPDFEESSRKFLSGTREDQFVLARHIFGSHEAKWAYHLDYWSEDKFRYVLGVFGFGDFRFEKYSNNLEQKIPVLKDSLLSKQEGVLKKLGPLGFNILPNIICHATKVKDAVNYKEAAREVLSLSLVGRETKILDVWMSEIEKKLP